ncbi:D-alanyl-D-alanine carboxypeptidase [Corynebacterium sp. sy017]|uniref:D-alanyl-D-alanine carboxypeptidase family protein n=1 Tax=unclassified Corynebacterium TaxID=2624378 RepID=UPI0011852FFF|nr:MULTISPECIES: serine hydrolase [unclassified Corynebacterium]MBP3088690.1 D-alanyl-D-alanine carboxypeptidase [Corynebacterium sp. sy017]TSD91978.1 D-alanyl-D-alanine carboxypeptidase [Corynebacterium sp. SY003]
MKRICRAVVATSIIICAHSGFALADPAPRDSAPDTNSCPNATYPPEAETTSEALAPGQKEPEALPTVENQFGSCGITAPKNFRVPENTASAWLVYNLDTGDVYATKDPHGRYRPASVIKVLLATVALEELPLDDTYVATQEDENQEGSAVGLKEGIRYTNKQLLYGLLLNSGNDAAHALAQQLGGDKATLTKINALAQKLGAKDTRAASYSGLDAPGMMTSAYDLALFYEYAWQNPTFATILATEFIDFPGPTQAETYQVWNDNGLFMNDEQGFGGKTGYTDDAHHTFVGGKDFDGTRIVAVILDTTIDTGRPWQQAQRLIDEAYATKKTVGTVEFSDASSDTDDSDDSGDSASSDAEEMPTADSDEATNAAIANHDNTDDHKNNTTPILIGIAVVGVIVLGVAARLRAMKRARMRARRTH